MDEHDQLVFEEKYLVNPDAACAYAADLGMLRPAPGRLKELTAVAAELNCAALVAARARGSDHVIQFLVHSRWEHPDGEMPAGEDPEDWTAGLQCVGYELTARAVPRERAEDRVRQCAEFQARNEERRHTRGAQERRRDADLRARRPRGPRRRGAGRPGHRSPARANAPPSDDDGPAEPEHDQPARRPRRAVCCRRLVA